MYVYNVDGEFGTILLSPVDYYHFWTKDEEILKTPPTVKPLTSLPEINWEISFTADEWRRRVANGTNSLQTSMVLLREIPDTFINNLMTNILYGQSMYTFPTANFYFPHRIGSNFTTVRHVLPGLLFAFSATSALIDEYEAEGTDTRNNQAETLRSLLRHLIYVIRSLITQHPILTSGGDVVVDVLDSDESPILYYDRENMRTWSGFGGSRALLAAEWVLNARAGDMDSIANAPAILAEWKTKINLS